MPEPPEDPPRPHRVPHRGGLPLVRAGLLVAFALTAGCSDGAASTVPEAPARPPNVLVVVLDTTRADRCGFVGYGRGTTPAIDRLAREGAAFTNAWSPAGWTGPAHASLFTGLRPEHHGFVLGVNSHLLEDPVTLAEHLGRAGWDTGAFSCNEMVSDEFGLLQGFDTKHVLGGADKALDHLGQRAFRLTRAWIESRTRPWFAFVNVMEPHLPYTPTWRHEKRFVPSDTDADHLGAMRAFDFPATISHMIGRRVLRDADLALLSDLYDAEVATADADLGAFVEFLREDGTLDETIVVVAGDHGENLGEHGLLEHRFSLHRSIRHVPLLVRYPPRVEAGRVEGGVVRLEDVMPTVLELCARPAPEGLDGETLTGDVGGRIARAILGPAPQEFRDRIHRLLGEDLPDELCSGVRAVTDGRHHLLRHDDGREELYDLHEDAPESRSRAADQPTVAERMRALLPEPPPR